MKLKDLFSKLLVFGGIEVLVCNDIGRITWESKGVAYLTGRFGEATYAFRGLEDYVVLTISAYGKTYKDAPVVQVYVSEPEIYSM